MPDRDVKTTKDQIYYQYAKIIARRAFTAGDGVEVERNAYGVVKNDLQGAPERRKELVGDSQPLTHKGG